MTVTDRRSIAQFLTVSAFAILGGCNSASGGPTGQNGNLDEALTSLEGAISDLAGNVGRFSDEDWKDVVPEVETDSANISDAFAQLKKALGRE
jgi:hypothetical protein